MGWRPIKDKLILHRWQCRCRTVELGPDWYEDRGSPVCHSCGEDMYYVETLLDCKFDPIRETLVISVRKEKNDS